ncbi:MAG: uracil phosphoribosyltransferase [Kiritimatiellae bacterium]|jgi:uracil phosphoribosyltransferase|nr:uracil phosphoribosyltransferase [Kiritimatiellia bacterium]NLE42332.1 uracil phosphoribosyltransferase [Lentisphaerota bacterium]
MHVEVKHPLIGHKLTLVRDKTTGVKLFRELIGEITMFLAYEALRGIPTESIEVETPLAVAKGVRVKGEIVLVPILRAGVGMLDAVMDMVPNARVGFLGLYRDHETSLPVEYYAKLPPATPGAVAILIDPMLATAGSAVAAVSMLKKRGFETIVFVCIVSCPEGVARLEQAHPDVAIYTASIDDGLNASKYILPGLGDAGDRLFGTK